MIGALPVPATYRIRLSGEVTGGVAFGPLPAELSLVPSKDRPGQVEVVIGTAGGLTVGDLTWVAGASGLDESLGGRCVVTVAGGDVTCEVEAPGGTFAVSWSDRQAGMPPSMAAYAQLAAAPVVATRALLRLRFAGAEVIGDLRATGLMGSNHVTYAATISGSLA